MIDKTEYRKRYLESLNQANEPQNAAPNLLSTSIKRSQKKSILAQAAPAREADEVEQLLRIVRDKKAGSTTRATALQKLDIAISNSEDLLNETLAILNDPKEPAELRRAALTVLEQASFSSAIFISKRPEFLNVLRAVVDDKDKQLRQDALEILAIQKDEYTQRRLLEGLTSPATALVAPAKAIQLLGYDVHAEIFPVLRDIAQSATDAESRLEAVRILGADPGSKDLLQGLLQDKNEKKEIRVTSAVAVQAISPEEFTDFAKQAVMDETEDSDVRAICLNAMSVGRASGSNGSDAREAFAASAADVDPDFEQYVNQLKGSAASKELKKAAAQYMRNMELKRNNPMDE